MSSSISIAIAVVAFLCFTYADFLQEQRYPEKDRLPLNIKPINYNITIIPNFDKSDLQKATFDGECFIEIQAAQDTNEIQLHIKNLDIALAEYYKKNTAQTTVLPRGSYNYSTDIQSYILNEALQANVSYILHFKYVGYVNEENIGLYFRKYKGPRNDSQFYTATNFGKSHARRVFPCFDKPNFKATFDLTLGETYYWNPRTSTSYKSWKYLVHNDSKITVYVYETTPKMSTSSLGFFFKSFNWDFFESGYTIEVFFRWKQYDRRWDIVHFANVPLMVLGDYLGFPYKSMCNEELKLVLIPGFPTTTTENWCFITIPELSFLTEDGRRTIDSKQNAVQTIAYAESLLWFGVMVTPEKWDFSWLKDGFGTYFGYFGGHMAYSSLRLDQQFVVDIQQIIMLSDFTENTLALDNMYDKYSSLKSACFIRMTKHILGEENFKTSLNEYLETHKYKNTVPSDLFTIWKKYWPLKHKKYADNFFKTFTTQVGFPVVTFNRTSATNVVISQKPFIPRDLDVANQNLSHTVPISFTTNVENDFENTSVKVFLEKSPVQITVKSDAKWIMGNIQAAGYYRVNYDFNTWQQIKQALNSENWGGIHELNRAQMVDDLFNLARAGEIDYPFVFDMLMYLRTETNYLPWTSAFNGFKYLFARAGTENGYLSLFIRLITEKVYNKLGFEERKDDSNLDILNRANILNWSCKIGNTDCIFKAKIYFNKNLTENPVPIDIRSAVYCVAMREGNDQDFDKLYNMYKTETVDSERKMILLSLGCVKDYKLISRVFDMILSADVDVLDKSDAMKSLFSSNIENVESFLVLIEQNFEKVISSKNIENVMNGLVYYLTTEVQLSRLHVLENKYRIDPSFNGALSRCKSLIDWSKANNNSIKKFFEQNATKQRKPTCSPLDVSPPHNI